MDKRSYRKVELLGYHTAECPHCKKEIFIPEYRQQPGTVKDYREQAREIMEEE